MTQRGDDAIGDRPSDVERRLIDAIGRQRLPPLLRDRATVDELLGEHPSTDDTDLVDRVRAIASSIADELRGEIDRLAPVVAAVSPALAAPQAGEFAQQHTLTMSVDDAEQAMELADALAPEGYQRRETWTGGADRSFRRHADLLTLVRPDGDAGGHTTSLRLRWRHDGERSTFERLTRPTTGDWAAIRLPSPLWWAYPGVRLVRLTAERAGLRRRHESGLGPYLTTPAALIDPLLEHVGVGPGSRVVDLGCGDGRLVAAAAERGASAVGVESDHRLVDLARRRHGSVVGARFETADARDLLDQPDGLLATADVALMFLPVDVAVELVPALRRTMPPGGRIMLHEQHHLPAGAAPPDRSRLVTAPGALTVAHTWLVSGETAGV